jgi:hypothetical protein
MTLQMDVETAFYFFGIGFFILPLLFIFLFKVDIGLMIFLAVAVCLQYLERFSFGFASALDLVGASIPMLLLFGLIIKGEDPIAAIKKDKVAAIFLLFILCTLLFGAIFSYFIVPYHSNVGLMGRIQRWGKFLNGFIIYFVAVVLTTSIKRANAFLNCILLSIIIPSMVMIYQLCIGQTHSRWQGAYEISRAGFHHGNVISYALVFCFPIAVYNMIKTKSSRDKLLWLFVAVTVIVLIFFTYRRTVWVGLMVQFVGFYIFAEKGRTRILLGYGVFAGVVALFMVEIYPVFLERFSEVLVFFSSIPNVFTSDKFDYLFSGRWGLFRVYFSFISKEGLYSLIFGNGVGSTHYAAYLGGKSIGGHNSYLILLLDYGLISLSLFTALLLMLFRRARLFARLSDVDSSRYGKFFLIVLASYIVMSLATHLIYFLTSGIWIFFSIAGMLSGIYLNMAQETSKIEYSPAT